jgi:tetratricopeptide (TPR) repeat protein
MTARPYKTISQQRITHNSLGADIFKEGKDKIARLHIRPHRLATHYFGRILLQIPELPVMLVGGLWMEQTGLNFINGFICFTAIMWFLSRTFLLQHAEKLLGKSRYHDAAKYIHVALKLNPNNAKAWLLLACSASQRNQFDWTIRYLERACHLEPNNIVAHSMLNAILQLVRKEAEPHYGFRFAVVEATYKVI